MIDAPAFEELIRRVRAGDPAAAEELVRTYEPAIRRAVRFRLADARLGTLLDSMDICQSVLASFFVRAASGQYELESPEQLLGLLTAMARNKLASESRRQHAQRRDTRRVSAADGAAEMVADPDDSPSTVVAARDLLQEVRRRLSPDERRLLEMRNQGSEWTAIAASLGGGAEALRRRLSRALDRVARELGLDDEP
ncbi:RNA polymerase sigma factor [Aquisphaera giovannonii]|uniref:RNA polymerase sigma factor n=1 Tax=Aquisphaera giovannonii TaxID=406548 RepID=A0A5B9WB25_9BACT|nr:sigma-70 family RNA polymerase sigma factor [Aquisphaera giovannonii]QEH37687.1 RNA polymerase sigma factor [Aquisphaera giovannonii]